MIEGNAPVTGSALGVTLVVWVAVFFAFLLTAIPSH
jgi:hypothetical protein